MVLTAVYRRAPSRRLPLYSSRVCGRARAQEACWAQWESSRRYAEVRRHECRIWPPKRYFRAMCRWRPPWEQPRY